MRQIVNGVAATHGVTASMKFETEFIETINSEGPTLAALSTAQSTGLDAIGDCAQMSFSEDFAHFCTAVPGCFILMGNGEQGSHGQPLHASDYDFNDELLPIGAAYWTQLVRDRLPIRKTN